MEKILKWLVFEYSFLSLTFDFFFGLSVVIWSKAHFTVTFCQPRGHFFKLSNILCHMFTNVHKSANFKKK